MEINVADERILLFTDQLNPEEAKQKAWDKKLVAIDTISKFTSFLSKPKDDDFELVYQEHRYQPFWHVAASAKYVYDRSNKYQVNVPTKEVKKITLLGNDYEVDNGHLHLSVLEHCIQEEADEVFVDGVTGKSLPELAHYLTLSPKEATGDLDKLVSKDSILVPPQTRVSAIMRDALAKMIKGIQADKIIEESVEVKCVDLYYHPIYAFKYHWKSKNKDVIIEVDGMTGNVTSGNRTFSEYLGKVLDTNFLFDVGADAAGMLIPGGSIAVKVAKKYLDSKKPN
jgi:hypothetical protein